VLGGPAGTSSQVASLSSTAQLIEDCVDITTANGVYWGTRSALAATLSHFLKMEGELELLGSRRNMDLTEDQADALWSHTCHASELLAVFIPPSVAHDSPHNMGEEHRLHMTLLTIWERSSSDSSSFVFFVFIFFILM
jgi:hypothetical protein